MAKIQIFFDLANFSYVFQSYFSTSVIWHIIEGWRLVEAVRKLVNSWGRSSIYNKVQIVPHPTSSADRWKVFLLLLSFLPCL